MEHTKGIKPDFTGFTLIPVDQPFKTTKSEEKVDWDKKYIPDWALPKHARKFYDFIYLNKIIHVGEFNSLIEADSVIPDVAAGQQIPADLIIVKEQKA